MHQKVYREFLNQTKGELSNPKDVFIKCFGDLSEEIHEVGVISSVDNRAMLEQMQHDIGATIEAILPNIAYLESEDESLQQLVSHNIKHHIAAAKRNIHLLTQSFHDELTGVLNRDFLSAWMRTNKSPYSIIFLDLDGLKDINDTFGHQKGDELVRDFGGFLKSTIRKDYDYVLRYGGDEFVIILQTDEKHVSQRVLEEIQSTQDFSFSYGIALSSEEKLMSPEEVIHVADERMYEHKNGKKIKLQFA